MKQYIEINKSSQGKHLSTELFGSIFKLLKEDACLHSAESPYHNLAFLNEKDFLTSLECFLGTLRSIVVHAFFIRNLARGLVPKVPYFWTSNYQILVLKVPEQFLNFQRTISAIKMVQTHVKH